ncbi:putative zinc finger protein [Halotydeus destructor]|nr:putative zinc finger protein [Halotydeus destructor]
MSRLDKLQVQFRERLRLEAKLSSESNKVFAGVIDNHSKKENTRVVQQIRKPASYSVNRINGSHLVTSSPTRPVRQAAPQAGPVGTRAVPLIPLSTRLPSKAKDLQAISAHVGDSCQPAITLSRTVSAKSNTSPTGPSVTPMAKGPLRKVHSSPGRPKGRDTTNSLPCTICGRNFGLQERLERHENICSKTKNRERKPFDSTKQRFKDQPKDFLVAYQRSLQSSKEKNGTTPRLTPSDWREKRDNFIRSIRSAKAQTEQLAGLSLNESDIKFV